MKSRIWAVLLVAVILTAFSTTAYATEAVDTSSYYYDQLDDYEKSIHALFQAETRQETVEYQLTVPVGYDSNMVLRSVHRAMTAFLYDDPTNRMLWGGLGYYSFNESTQQLSFSMRYMDIATEFNLAKADSKRQTIVDSIGTEGDTYTKLRKLCDYMDRTMDYDWHSVPASGSYKGTYDGCALGCLCLSEAVCAGFADTVKMLCDDLGIPCIVVGNYAHAWNYILMDDGKWYNLDLTNYNADEVDLYFLLGTTNRIYMEHEYYTEGADLYLSSPDEGFIFPTLNTTQYAYTGANQDFSYTMGEHLFTWAEKWLYTVNVDGESCTVTGYEGTGTGNMEIPSVLGGLPVTAIGDGAFLGSKNFTGDLIIPDTVETIGNHAFFGYDTLKGELLLPVALESIGNSAFTNCCNLSGNLVFPDTLASIGGFAFYDCQKFTGDLTIPKDAVLGNQVFYGCYLLDGTVTLPDTLEVFDPSLIGGTVISCVALYDTNENFAVYDGVLYSNDMTTLLWCPSGKTGTLNIPEGVTTVARKAVGDCYSLTGELKLPSTLETIEYWGFGNCRFSGDLVLPDSIKTIGPWAFAMGSTFTSVSVGSGCQTIDENAFFGLYTVKNVTILSADTTIASDAFIYCDGVETMRCLPNSSAQAIAETNGWDIVYCFYQKASAANVSVYAANITSTGVNLALPIDVFYNHSDSGTAICALYGDNGQMLDAQILQLSAGSNQYTITHANDDAIRVALFFVGDDYAPICEKFSFQLQKQE